MSDIYLVQRLSVSDRAKPGFDGLFSCEYQGSAEFEYGAIPASLKRIRASGPLGVLPQELTVDDVTRTVWLAGATSNLDTAAAELFAWANGKRPFHAKEMTYFPEKFTGAARDYMRTIAWWTLECDFAWTLDEATAELLVRGFTPAA